MTKFKQYLLATVGLAILVGGLTLLGPAQAEGNSPQSPYLVAIGSPFQALQKQIDALDAKVNRLIGVVRQNVTDIGTLEGNVSDVQDDVTSLQDDVGALQMDVSDLQAALAGVRQVTVATAEDTQSTSSVTLAPLPDMSVTFTTTEPGPAVVWFHVVTIDDEAIVALFVNGVRQFQQDIQTHPNECCAPTTINWAVPNLSAGTHTVEVQWAGKRTGATVNVRSLVVQHPS